jgi:hypothetical protein
MPVRSFFVSWRRAGSEYSAAIHVTKLKGPPPQLPLPARDRSLRLIAALVLAIGIGVVFHDPVALFTVHTGQSTAILRLHLVSPTRYPTIRKVCTAMGSIPAGARQTSERILMEGLKGLLFRVGLQALVLHKLQERAETAVVLRDFFGANDLYRPLSLGRRVGMAPSFLELSSGAHKVRRRLIELRVRGQEPRLDEFFAYSNRLTGLDHPRAANEPRPTQS